MKLDRADHLLLSSREDYPHGPPIASLDVLTSAVPTISWLHGATDYINSWLFAAIWRQLSEFRLQQSESRRKSTPWTTRNSYWLGKFGTCRPEITDYQRTFYRKAVAGGFLWRWWLPMDCGPRRSNTGVGIRSRPVAKRVGSLVYLPFDFCPLPLNTRLDSSLAWGTVDHIAVLSKFRQGYVQHLTQLCAFMMLTEFDHYPFFLPDPFQ